MREWLSKRDFTLMDLVPVALASQFQESTHQWIMPTIALGVGLLLTSLIAELIRPSTPDQEREG